MESFDLDAFTVTCAICWLVAIVGIVLGGHLGVVAVAGALVVAVSACLVEGLRRR